MFWCFHVLLQFPNPSAIRQVIADEVTEEFPVTTKWIKKTIKVLTKKIHKNKGELDGGILSQCACVLNHHNVHLNILQFYMSIVPQ